MSPGSAKGIVALLLAMLVFSGAPVEAAPGRAACSIRTSDPRVTLDDAVEIDLEDRTLRALRWTSDRTTRDDAHESHAFECRIAMDAQTSLIKRTTHGWTATSSSDPTCRLEILGDGIHLALIPVCRSSCSTGRALHPLAVDLASGLCRPLDGRPVEKLKP